VDILEPGSNTTPKHISWQNSVGFGHGTNNNLSDAVTAISWTATTTTPGADWYIYGIR